MQLVFAEPVPIQVGLALRLDSAFRQARVADVSEAVLESTRLRPCQENGCWEWAPSVRLSARR
jgi:hypothetical protein